MAHKSESADTGINDQIIRNAYWNHRLAALLWKILAVAFVFEIVTNATYYIRHIGIEGWRSTHYVVTYLAIPCVVLFATVLIAQIAISSYIMPHCSDIFCSRFVLVVLVIMCTETVAFHHGVSVIYTVYVLPIFLSAIFYDRITLILIYVTSMAMYISVFFLYINIFVLKEDYYHDFLSIFGTLAILSIAFMVSMLLLGRIHELIEIATQKAHSEAQLSHQLSLDAVSGLYNRAFFNQSLDEHIVKHQLKQETFSVMLIRICNYRKSVRDIGKAAGDTLVAHLVAVAEKACEGYNAPFTYEEDAICCIVPDTQDATVIAEKFFVALDDHIVPGFNIKLAVNIGICSYSEAYFGRKSFLENLGKQVQEAVSLGDNRMVISSKAESRQKATTNKFQEVLANRREL